MSSSQPTSPAGDRLGAFVATSAVARNGSSTGPLAGIRFAAKDLFDIAGHVSSCGNPQWLDSHGPAEKDAPAVAALLDAGASLVGVTVMDELAYSLGGENVHHGTPHNASAPGRVCGGSSSGSASAVAGGDGSDAGSVTKSSTVDCGGSFE